MQARHHSRIHWKRHVAVALTCQIKVCRYSRQGKSYDSTDQFSKSTQVYMCKECFNCATDLSILSVKGKIATRYKHFYEAKPCYAKHLIIWGEANTVSMGKNRKVGN